VREDKDSNDMPTGMKGPATAGGGRAVAVRMTIVGRPNVGMVNDNT
jgi:hypothetical protein